ncbi:MAG: hypothetical protein IH571_06770, partial [Acholeplasmataceae bacterium]|nr:hypothetical protein [Acholeplasmataceae bacterium]
MRKFNLSLLVLISVIVFSGCTFELHVPQYPYYIEDLTYEDQSTFQLITDFEQLIN